MIFKSQNIKLNFIKKNILEKINANALEKLLT